MQDETTKPQEQGQNAQIAAQRYDPDMAKKAMESLQRQQEVVRRQMAIVKELKGKEPADVIEKKE